MKEELVINFGAIAVGILIGIVVVAVMGIMNLI